MNAAERRVLSKMYACLNAITGMMPNNPANLVRKCELLDIINRASIPLLHTLSALNNGDIEGADASVSTAAQILEGRHKR